MDHALAELGGIDLLVNNVGGGDPVPGFLETDDTQWTASLDLNLLSAVRATRAALPSLIERRGSIVNISSVIARQPGTGTGVYGGAKAGVRINTVTPGVTRTAVFEQYAELLPQIPEAPSSISSCTLPPATSSTTGPPR